VITNKRLVDSSRSSPFRHHMTSAMLENVIDVSISRRGIFPTLFKYGDVVCRTAAGGKAFSFKGVANPETVMRQINEAREASRQATAAMLQTTISDAISSSNAPQ
jgi:hypothetical protein